MKWKLYRELVSQSIQESLSYKGTTIIVMIFSVLFFAIEMIVGMVLFNSTATLGGWLSSDYFLLISSATLITSLYQFLFIVAHENLAESIIEGSLDYTFLRPVNSFYYYAFNRIDPPSLINTVLSSIVILYLCNSQHIGFTIVPYVICIAMGVWFLFLVNQCVVTLSFWVEKSSKLLALPEYLSDISSKPYTIYPKSIIFFLTWIMPFFVAFNYPVLILKGEMPIYNLCYFALFLFFLHKGTTLLWKKGIAKYQSSN
ncbi:MAG: ABC transporter permease [Culicoidibacterales bacterium]